MSVTDDINFSTYTRVSVGRDFLFHLGNQYDMSAVHLKTCR
jgi:hypothetical protein